MAQLGNIGLTCIVGFLSHDSYLHSGLNCSNCTKQIVILRGPDIQSTEARPARNAAPWQLSSSDSLTTRATLEQL